MDAKTLPIMTPDIVEVIMNDVNIKTSTFLFKEYKA